MGKYKNSNAWMLQGQCVQWLDKQDLSGNELKVYISILNKSFGYKHRWCYLSYDDFGLSKATVNKTIKSLIDKKIISSKWTFKDNGHRGKNEYMLLEPKNHISNFVFKNNEQKESSNKQEEEIDELPF